mmetsp:Transcript_53722/g.114676  ORF Transcript_53722/g.114676 Transcript_53722/m.114676 type:complete len:413 (-) Transcript_53722:92-1330(-)|eukprot:CAMPEP_0206472772 /NCGR_PEP_ID=MMETSP0324_2-20121206/32422_1 /ASSEMBLY_ACC=CAM_ASM_000836 /TAXON_ID=2866 /ORGANISM="Crypthecodinium cohnii, Strain Seligo" /LENGTH=412 /DNA_ID=CAMNT_0053947481 /DNA_START=58 /DNA_END=1296 /DNA_ORIENTATION=-
MRVLLRPPDGKKKDDIEMDIDAEELIESVRQKIQANKNFDCNKLLFRGTGLKDDRTLKSYNVPDGATIIVQGSYHGQYLPMGVTPQMEKRKAEEAMLEQAPAELAPAAKRAATAAAEENLSEATIPHCNLRVAVYGEKGMRRQMEDEHLICPSLRGLVPTLPEEREFAVFGVFDGHGGKQVAAFVKTYLAVELANSLLADEPTEGPLPDKRLKKVIEGTFHRLDARIAVELQGCYDGCTAVILLVNREQVICANLGDSMAYLCRSGAEDELQPIPLQLRQHKCWMMKEKERILRAGGAVENGRINGSLEVSRAFGDITLKKFGVLCTPEYMKFQVDLTKDRFVLMACDGFWNAWTHVEAVDYTAELLQRRAEEEGDDLDLKDCVRELVQFVVEEKKAQDNVSVVLVRFAKAN